ncbi:MAG: hypothetical protein U0169_21270 [Polyangiaceae bacterium]
MRPFVRISTWCLGLALAATAGTSHAANDPTLKWRTLETEHFRINFYSGEEELARHLADLAEGVYTRMSPVVGWAPDHKTEIAITDQSDSANGSATALPFNTVRLFATAPDDLSPLGDVDDWFLELFTHEFTHILHTDHIRGFPSLVNKVLGKTVAPNQVQPRWLLEGLAVFEESSKTSGGRLRSSQWNMYMRADVLEGNVATLDQFSNTPRRFPQANIWYLYGSFFLRYVAETYGEDAIRKMIDDYGRHIVPWGINRSIRRATGKTFEELYPEWIASLQREYGAQAARIRARGIREGTRLTFSGQTARSPRFVPKGSWAGAEGDIVYFRDDAHTRAGFYRVPVRRDPTTGVMTGTDGKGIEFVVRTSSTAQAAFTPEGDVVFEGAAPTKGVFLFEDLYRMKAGVKDVTGIDDTRERLTHGFRASMPDVSPDGTRVTFVSNTRGTSYLQIADLGPDGISNVRSVVPSAKFDQAFSPRFSPDGLSIAYSSWKKGGYRDVEIVDLVTKRVRTITRDRAIDGGPTWSPDGKTLFFHSDRTGVMNVFAYDVTSGDLRQVTNVVNGAYQPVISPDGKTLVYVGFTHAGFDLYAMHLDRELFLPAEPYENDRPTPHVIEPRSSYEIGPYNPLVTLRPRNYGLDFGPSNFGYAATVSVGGGDIAGRHAVSASLKVETDVSDPQFEAAYYNGIMPFDVGLRAFRSLSPAEGFRLGQNYRPPGVLENLGFESSLSVGRPRQFDGHSFALSYVGTRLVSRYDRPVSRLDPYETPSIPPASFLTYMHLGWGYTNAVGFTNSLGAEHGVSMSAAFDLTHPWLASDYQGYSANADITGYFLMPWLRHHSLALHGGGGMGSGGMPGRGAFYVGGLVDLPVLDVLRSYLVQGGIALRGYPVALLTGRYYALANAEYRFPILTLDRGVSTLPIYLSRLFGNVFVDYGSAFDDPATAALKTGVGGELWFDFQLGYGAGFLFRLGYARGLASGGIDKPYFVASLPF